MSKIGIVRDGAISVNKPVKLEFINRVETSSTSIRLIYNLGVPLTLNIGSNIVILLANPEPLTYTAELIRKRVLKWIGEGLASSSVLTLNDYLDDIVVTQVGVVGDQTTGNIITAADSTAACAATPNIPVALDFSGSSAPLVGTGIYLTNGPLGNPTGPVAAGTYALNTGVSQYFITVNDFSVISSIEICPLLLDFVYNLQNLTNPITEPNPDAISFSLDPNLPFDPGATTYNQYYNPPLGAATDVPDIELCAIFTPPGSRDVYGNDNAYWPVGLINNGTTNVPNFAVDDVAFGLQLADSNVADFNQAQLYISFDLNANAGVVADATFVPFALPFGQIPVFTGSPGGGIPGFGDGTSIFDPANAGSPGFTIAQQFRTNLFLPSGSSLVGTANFPNGAYCQWDTQTGTIQNVPNTSCLS